MTRKFTVMLSFFLTIANLHAQNYEISFEGSNSEIISSVIVKNLTQGTEKTLNGNDVLHLLNVPTAVEQVIDQNSGLRVYPNPMTKNSSIEFNASVSCLATISIFDITGKQVILEQRNIEVGTHVFKLNNLSTGIYTMSVQTGSNLYSAKLVSQSKSIGNAALSYVSKTALKSSMSKNATNVLVEMQYNTNDELHITAISNDLAAVKTIVPTATATETLDFYECVDFDGNNYKVVTIGKQVWMAENLKVTHYPNGDAIPIVNDEWGTLGDNDTDDAMCYYNNNANNEADTYGALYTHAAASHGNNSETDKQCACPTGWHLPSDLEWRTLEMELGMTQTEAFDRGFRGTDQGSQLAGNADLWNDGILKSNANFGTSGFLGLPAGYRDFSSGQFKGLGKNLNFWSATQSDASSAWVWVLMNTKIRVYHNGGHKSYGFSVRCIRD